MKLMVTTYSNPAQTMSHVIQLRNSARTVKIIIFRDINDSNGPGFMRSGKKSLTTFYNI